MNFAILINFHITRKLSRVLSCHHFSYLAARIHELIRNASYEMFLCQDSPVLSAINFTLNITQLLVNFFG